VLFNLQPVRRIGTFEVTPIHRPHWAAQRGRGRQPNTSKPTTRTFTCGMTVSTAFLTGETRLTGL